MDTTVQGSESVQVLVLSYTSTAMNTSTPYVLAQVHVQLLQADACLHQQFGFSSGDQRLARVQAEIHGSFLGLSSPKVVWSKRFSLQDLTPSGRVELPAAS